MLGNVMETGKLGTECKRKDLPPSTISRIVVYGLDLALQHYQTQTMDRRGLFVEKSSHEFLISYK